LSDNLLFALPFNLSEKSTVHIFIQFLIVADEMDQFLSICVCISINSVEVNLELRVIKIIRKSTP